MLQIGKQVILFPRLAKKNFILKSVFNFTIINADHKAYNT